jgi:transposase
MNPFGTPDRLFIYTRPQDMRAGIQRLASVITTDMCADPTDGALFVFISRDKEKIKMLRFETNGWCMYYVRLCDSGFKWQHTDNDLPILKVERRQLLWLLEGLEIEQLHASKPVNEKSII